MILKRNIVLSLYDENRRHSFLIHSSIQVRDGYDMNYMPKGGDTITIGKCSRYDFAYNQ